MASETELEYAKEFWTTANVVAGFSIIQMIAYLFAMGGGDSKIRQDVLSARWWVLGAIILAPLLDALQFYLLDPHTTYSVRGIQEVSRR